MFFAISSNRNKFCDFLFASLDDKVLPKCVYPLLKKGIWSKFFLKKNYLSLREKNENGRVALPETVPIHFKWRKGYRDSYKFTILTLLHSEWPKLHRVLAILRAIGLRATLLITKKQV